MCPDPSLSTSNAGVPGDLLNRILNVDAQGVPKVSLPAESVGAPSKLLAAALGAPGHDTNGEVHVTADEVFVSAITPATSKEPALVTTVGPTTATQLTIEPPSPTASSASDELWKVGMSVTQVVAPGTLNLPAKPQVTLGVYVAGNSAKIASYKPSPSASVELEALGINAMCIIKNGGLSILSTIVSCLPSLAGGPQAFMAALLAALGPGSVDLVKNVMACV